MENILKFMKLIVNLVYSHNIAKWKRFKYEIEAFFLFKLKANRRQRDAKFERLPSSYSYVVARWTALQH